MSDPVARRLDHWRRQLIDLTNRNRLLNFRPTPVTTIRVVDELPSEVFRLLQIEGRALSFLPLPESPPRSTVSAPAAPLSDPLSAEPSDAPALLENREDSSTVSDAPTTSLAPEADLPLVDERQIVTETTEFQRLERAAMASHQIDTSLQTNLAAERLATNLLRIYQTATGALEDQGVNSLFLALGMVEWYEEDRSADALKAPLILLPVQLLRQTARSQYALRTTQEDPVLNPALAEKLRLDFRLTLPALPETFEDFDPQEYLAAAQEAVAVGKRWRVTNDIYLGLFSFEKFVMYKDIELNEAQFVQHPAIQALCLGQSERIRPLPAEVAEARLDQVLRPEQTTQVLDADSSQQRALLAVQKGYDLVLEGPPGTGKSQTIGNLIGGALAEGKSVLFVSEKRAALEVVYRRLATLGLNDFCLELHSNKTSKRAVIAELARVLDLARPADQREDGQLGQLAQLRDELNGYASELHTPYGRLGLSPYRAFGEVLRRAEAPAVNAELPGLAECDLATLEQTCRDLAEHASLLAEVGDPTSHPWRGSQLQSLDSAGRDRLAEALERALAAIHQLGDSASGFAARIGASPIASFGDVERLSQLALALAESPGVEESLLRDSRWDTRSPEAQESLTIGQRFAPARREVLMKFMPELLESDFRPLLARYAEHSQSFLRLFKPGYYQDRKASRAYQRPECRPAGNAGLLADLNAALAVRSDMLALRARDAAGRSLFGVRWQGTESNWADLERLADWLVRLRGFIAAGALQEQGIALAARGDLDAAPLQARSNELRAELVAARNAVAQVVERAQLGAGSGVGYDAHTNLLRLYQRLQELQAKLGRLYRWTFYQASLAHCQQGLAGDFLRRVYEQNLPPEAREPAFRRLFFRRWLDLAAAERPKLARFSTLSHEQRIAEFKRLDQRALDLARQRVRHRLAQSRNRLADPALSEELQLIQREYRKKARHLPLRLLLAGAPNAIRLIKPCFMMSPLSVAQFLNPALHRFDLIVFDEASQIAPEDAIGAVVRGAQVVVVGDSNQLPPTNFFSAQITVAEDVEQAEEEPLPDDVESVLDEFAAVGFPRWRLKWHYRSQHESLITFSNQQFYDGELLTFPGPDTDRLERGVKWEWVGGVYEGKGVNPLEAQAVADAVVEHIRARPELSLGVGTFNLKQQFLILDELERRRRADPGLEFFFANQGEDGFFVKNLENIQGDERDLIFLSITYGPDASGAIRYNFGPINGQNGWRRLNVILTRAKQQLRVFSSLRGDQIDLTRAKSYGAQLLRDYLLFAERGTLSAPTVDPEAQSESPFELSVCQELTRRGLRLVPQVGQAGYRIDFGVLDDAVAGRFVCGIECDGRTYHSAATARDRDRLRQQVLEGLGWRIHRVWSTDWYHDRDAQIERLLHLVERSRQQACAEAAQREAEQAARAALAHSHGTLAEVIPADMPERSTLDSPTQAAPASSERAASEPVAPVDASVPDYRLAPVRRLGMPDDFPSAPDGLIATVLVQIAQVEAPIHIQEAARRVAAHWGLSRVSPRARGRVEAIAHALPRPQGVWLEDDYLWYRTKTTAARRRPSSFDTELIAPEEFEAAVRHALRTGGTLMTAQLAQEAARVLGYERVGARLREQINAAVQDLVARSLIQIVAGGVRLADSHLSGPA